MPALTPALFGCTLLSILALAVMVLWVKQHHRQRHLASERIIALQHKIDAALKDEGFETAREAFSVSLKTASLTTSLQRSRLDTMAKIDKQPPEKYRILGKLASQGMGAEEIAAVLGISRIEAGQLLSLCHMAKIGR